MLDFLWDSFHRLGIVVMPWSRLQADTTNEPVAYQLVFAGISIFYFQGARSKFSFDDLTYQIQQLWMDPSQEALQYNHGYDPATNLQNGPNQYPENATHTHASSIYFDWATLTC